MSSLLGWYSLDQTFGVLQCGSSKELSDTNQTDSIYLQNLIIYPNSVKTKHQRLFHLEAEKSESVTHIVRYHTEKVSFWIS